MADRITSYHDRQITSENLIIAYRQLISLLADYEVPATFAFVMAFTLRKHEHQEWLPVLRNTNINTEMWMRHFHAADKRRNFDGWFCPEAFEMVRNCGDHEIGCHGFTHLPLSENCAGPEEVASELGNALKLAQSKSVDLRTFVFPRNQTGYLSVLRNEGFLGFRNTHPDFGRSGRIGNLLREFDTNTKAQKIEEPQCGMISIPGGHLLNWRQGIRRAIPKSLTLTRWSSILKDAVARDRTALLFMHPHNLIDGPGTLDLLAGVLRMAAHLRDTNDLSIVTQADFCALHARNMPKKNSRPVCTP